MTREEYKRIIDIETEIRTLEVLKERLNSKDYYLVLLSKETLYVDYRNLQPTVNEKTMLCLAELYSDQIKALEKEKEIIEERSVASSKYAPISAVWFLTISLVILWVYVGFLSFK